MDAYNKIKPKTPKAKLFMLAFGSFYTLNHLKKKPRK